MLAALVLTATDLAVGLLLAASVASLLFAAGVFLGRCIHGAETPPFIAPDEPKEPADLDDWLGREGLDFDFKVSKRPESSAQMGRRVA